MDTSRLIAARMRLGDAGSCDATAREILVAALIDLAGVRSAAVRGTVPDALVRAVTASGVEIAPDVDDADLVIVGDDAGPWQPGPVTRLLIAPGAEGLAGAASVTTLPGEGAGAVAARAVDADDPLHRALEPTVWGRAARVAERLAELPGDIGRDDLHTRLIDELDRLNARTVDSLHRAEDRAAASQRHAEEAHRDLEAIVKSDSWRLTAPVRAVGEFIRRRRASSGAVGGAPPDHSALFNPALNVDYAIWHAQFDTIDAAVRQRLDRLVARLGDGPEFSVLMPVYNTPERYLRRAIESVIDQAYPRWELCIADDASTASHVRAVLDEYAAADDRIRIVCRDRNGHISAATNSAYAISAKPYVALLDHDDELRPHALYAMAEHLIENPGHRLVYSDEDRITPDGERFGPHFKPDFNHEQLLGQNYITHLCVLDRRLIDEVGLMREGFEGSQDHDLMLRCAAALGADEIGHVPRILYHWRVIPGSVALDIDEKPYAVEAGRAAVEEHLRATDPAAVVVHGDAPATYRVRLSVPEPHPRISIVIPTRNGLPILRRCVESIRRLSTYDAYELLIVDNQSDDPDTRAYLRALAAQSDTRVLAYDAPFNYSAINNMAAREANGEYLILLNNDTEVISPSWIEELLSWCSRPGIGTVGARLYYPDGSTQHAGLVMGIGGTAGHGHKNFDPRSLGYFGRLCVVHEVGGNTAACLMIRRDVYLGHGGLNERHLAVAYNDVDLCLRLSDAGLRHITTPFAKLVHHESKTRGSDEARPNRARHDRERNYLMWRWMPALRSDPGYNPNLTLDKEDFSLAFPPRVPPLEGTTDPG